MSKKKSSRVPDGETPEGKFRRVFDERVKPLLKRYQQITNMVIQPSYDPNTEDLKKAVALVQKEHEKFLSQYQRAIDGTLKAKDIKEFSGVDWDAELNENNEE